MVTEFPTVADPVASMLGQQVIEGINKVVEANKVLLAETEQGTGVREIDKALKDYIPSEGNDVSEKDKEIVKAAQAWERAKKNLKDAQEKARNLYRTKVLGEEAQAEHEEMDSEHLDALKNSRKLTMKAVELLKDYATTNNLPEVVKWTENLEVPQVGRAGTSTVGQKKPRARVSVNGEVHESFGEAAKAASAKLSTEDKKVEVTSGDLVSAWDAAGEKDEFDFQGLAIKVTKKERKTA